MVGGGEGAFIGGVHRMAARLDDRWSWSPARCPSRSPERARRSARAICGLARRSQLRRLRRRMAAARGRAAPTASTPSPSSRPTTCTTPVGAGLPRRRHRTSICDKPLTTTLADADELARCGARTRRALRAHPQLQRLPDGASGARAWWRRASSARSASCRSNTRRTGWRRALERPGNKQADWRSDPGARRRRRRAGRHRHARLPARRLRHRR